MIFIFIIDKRENPTRETFCPPRLQQRDPRHLRRPGPRPVSVSFQEVLTLPWFLGRHLTIHGSPTLRSEKLLALANRQFNRREYHLAEDLVNFVLKKDNQNIDARLLLARTLDRAGRRNLAIQELEIISRLCRRSNRDCPEASALMWEIGLKKSALDGDTKASAVTRPRTAAPSTPSAPAAAYRHILASR